MQSIPFNPHRFWMDVHLLPLPHRSQISSLAGRSSTYAAAWSSLDSRAGRSVHQRRARIHLALHDWNTSKGVELKGSFEWNVHCCWNDRGVPERGATGLENRDTSLAAGPRMSMVGDVGMGCSSVDVSWDRERCEGGERGSSLAADNTETSEWVRKIKTNEFESI